MIPEPGIYPDIADDEYFSWPAASNSGLRKLSEESAKHYKHAQEMPRKPTEAMEFGSLFHLLTLKPFDFNHIYAVCPQVDRRTKAGKAAWAEFKERAAGRLVVSQADYEQARQMAHAVTGDASAGKVLAGQPEVAVVWDDDETGIRCKAKLDSWGSVIGDLKSTVSANPVHIERALWNYGYHQQAAFYLDGAKAAGNDGTTATVPTRFLFVFVEKAPPWDVNVVELDDESLMAGRSAYKRALFVLKHCRETDKWPGYGHGVTQVRLPKWAIEQELGDG